MLLNLRIRDFVIIDAVELEFPPGFTVITGETGAGKSIVVDALCCTLGSRVTQDVVRSGAVAAEVEALFDISAHALIRARLAERDLLGDDPDMLLVRRVIGPKGKAKVLVNGRLATVGMLAEIVRGLVEISGQHEQQSLLDVLSHQDILDTYGEFSDLRQTYRQAYEFWRSLVKQREVLQRDQAQALQRLDFLRFQFQEISHVAPRVGEDDELESERQRLSHVEKLKLGVGLAEQLLYSEDGSVFDKLGKAAAELQALAQVDAELRPSADQLDSLRHDIEETSRTLRRYADRMEVDPNRLDDVESRLALIKKLCRKYGGSIADVLAHATSIEQELHNLENAGERQNELDAQEARAYAQVLQIAADLSAVRRESAARLDQAILQEICEMDLAAAVFRTSVTSRAEITSTGCDEVEFLWSANPGEPLRSLAKIASGGELSRLMLAVKSVLSQHDLVSVYIFDEVDTGLGGKAADCIGQKIHRVSMGHQAITITHLAPIAAHANQHLRVSKNVVDDRTFSNIEWVTGQARAEEIARMIDGAKITDVTRKAAKEMLKRRAS
jgi:DNA repair protein RecN (Recombination protein N)